MWWKFTNDTVQLRTKNLSVLWLTIGMRTADVAYKDCWRPTPRIQQILSIISSSDTILYEPLQYMFMHISLFCWLILLIMFQVYIRSSYNRRFCWRFAGDPHQSTVSRNWKEKVIGNNFHSESIITVFLAAVGGLPAVALTLIINNITQLTLQAPQGLCERCWESNLGTAGSAC